MSQGVATADTVQYEKVVPKDELYQKYSEWAIDAQYEQDLCETNYRAPLIAAEAMADLFPEAVRKDLYILDIAAGTGLVAGHLKNRGFVKIDALEPVENMINVVKSKNLYLRTFQNFLGEDSAYIEPDYDAVVVCGGMSPGHIPCSGLDEMIRLTKPGGHVIIVMYKKYLTSVEEFNGRLEPRMKQLELEGKWEAVSRRVEPNYYHGGDGAVFIFKVTGK
ncbi:methyltransferase-like protein 27 [Physella acuta]|uniref:methyltransferase-like protein 27 n=1 Tax=Physella acuta TaxID=109671 RepID=UPI0027DAEF5E|nr:methyltransferase-like protein 27 [Physella acuta]